MANPESLVDRESEENLQKNERQSAILRLLDNTEDGNQNDDDSDEEEAHERNFEKICEFFINCTYFLKNYKAPTMSELGRIIGVVFTGFFVFGFLAFAIKVIHIPFNQILAQD